MTTLAEKHYENKAIDEIGRLQVPKYVQELLHVSKGDFFELSFNTKKKVITFKLIEKEGD